MSSINKLKCGKCAVNVPENDMKYDNFYEKHKKSKERQQDIIYCSSCNNNAFHASCLGLIKGFGLFSQWKCEDCGNCSACGGVIKDKTFLVICYSCDKFYHCPSCVPNFKITDEDSSTIPWNCTTCLERNFHQETQKVTSRESSGVEKQIDRSALIERKLQSKTNERSKLGNKEINNTRSTRKRKVNSRYSDIYICDDVEKTDLNDENNDDNSMLNQFNYLHSNELKTLNYNDSSSASVSTIKASIDSIKNANIPSTSFSTAFASQPEVIAKQQCIVSTRPVSSSILSCKSVRPSVVRKMELPLASRRSHEHLDPKIIDSEQYKNKKTPGELSKPKTSSININVDSTKGTVSSNVIHYFSLIASLGSDASRISHLYIGNAANEDKQESSKTLLNSTKVKLPPSLQNIKLKRIKITNEDHNFQHQRNLKLKRISRCLNHKNYEKPNLSPLVQDYNTAPFMGDCQAIFNFNDIGIDYFKKTFDSPDEHKHSLLHEMLQQKLFKTKEKIVQSSEDDSPLLISETPRLEHGAKIYSICSSNSLKSPISGPSSSSPVTKKIVLSSDIVSSLIASRMATSTTKTTNVSSQPITFITTTVPSQTTKTKPVETIAVQGNFPMMGNFTIRLPTLSSASTTTPTIKNKVFAAPRLLFNPSKSAQPARSSSSSVCSYKIISDRLAKTTNSTANDNSRLSIRMAKSTQAVTNQGLTKSNSGSKFTILTSTSVPISINSRKITVADTTINNFGSMNARLNFIRKNMTEPPSECNIRNYSIVAKPEASTSQVKVAMTNTTNATKTMTTPTEVEIIGNKEKLAADIHKKLSTADTRKELSISETEKLNRAKKLNDVEEFENFTIASLEQKIAKHRKSVKVTDDKNNEKSKLVELNDKKTLVRTIHVTNIPLKDNQVVYNEEMMVVPPDVTIVNLSPFRQILTCYGIRYILDQGKTLTLPSEITQDFSAKEKDSPILSSLASKSARPSWPSTQTFNDSSNILPQKRALIANKTTQENIRLISDQHLKKAQVIAKNAQTPKLPPRRIFPNMKRHEVELIEIFIPAFSPIIHGGRGLMNFKIPRQKVYDFLREHNAEIIKVKDQDNFYELAPRHNQKNKIPEPDLLEPTKEETTEKINYEVFPSLQYFNSESDFYSFTPYFTAQIAEQKITNKMLDLSTLSLSDSQEMDEPFDENGKHLLTGPYTLITNHMDRPSMWKIDDIQYVIQPKQRFFITTNLQSHLKLNYKTFFLKEDNEDNAFYNQVRMNKKPKFYEPKTHDGLIDTMNLSKLKCLKEKYLNSRKSKPKDIKDAYQKANQITNGSIQMPKTSYIRFKLKNKSAEVFSLERILKKISADKVIKERVIRLSKLIQKSNTKKFQLSSIKTDDGLCLTRNSVDLSNIEPLLPQQLTLDRFQRLSKVKPEKIDVINCKVSLSDNKEKAEISYRFDGNMSELFPVLPNKKIVIPKKNIRRVDNKLQVNVTEVQKHQLFYHLKPDWRKHQDAQLAELKRKQQKAQKWHEYSSKRFIIHKIDYEMGVTYVESTVQGKKMRMELNEFKDFLTQLRNEFENKQAQQL